MLWIDKKINRTEATLVIYCITIIINSDYSYYASIGIPTLLRFIDSNAMYSGHIMASITQGS